MRKSFKSLEHEIITILGRHGYLLKMKLKDIENTDTRIYTKGLLDGCVVSSHRGDISSITLSFSDNYIQMTYSALIAITFDMEANIKNIFIDHTGNRKYSSIYDEINQIIRRVTSNG